MYIVLHGTALHGTVDLGYSDTPPTLILTQSWFIRFIRFFVLPAVRRETKGETRWLASLQL